MRTLAEMRKALADKNLSQVGRETEIHPNQVWRLANGVDQNPTYKTLEKLDNWLTEQADDQPA